MNANEFFVVAGAELYPVGNPAPASTGFFASSCGSPIYKRDDAAPEVLGFRLGTLDSDPARTADVHYMVGSKAP